MELFEALIFIHSPLPSHLLLHLPRLKIVLPGLSRHLRPDRGGSDQYVVMAIFVGSNIVVVEVLVAKVSDKIRCGYMVTLDCR